MLPIIFLIAVLVFCWISAEARLRWNTYVLKRNHVECLMRLDDQVLVSLPPDTGEMVSAAINEEMCEV